MYSLIGLVIPQHILLLIDILLSSGTKDSFVTCWFYLVPNISTNQGIYTLTGPRITDPSILKKEALNLVKGWPSELTDIIQSTPDDIIIKTPLVDRWLWPGFSPPASKGNVVVIGDAWHPMAPNLGQGACCALEDSVVLAGKLAGALSSGNEQMVDRALREFGQERWGRVFPLSVRANFVGSFMQWENPVVCGLRDNVIIPKLVRLGPFLEHTNFECELMEPIVSS